MWKAGPTCEVPTMLLTTQKNEADKIVGPGRQLIEVINQAWVENP